MASYRSFIFPGARVTDDRAILDARESHHLVRVLRARKHDSVELLDGAGNKYHGRLEQPDARAAVVSLARRGTVHAPTPRLTLLQAVPKGKTMDLILRMATEIGVSRVVPIFTAQGEVQLTGERLLGKLEKWRLTMVEACKQCGLPFLPELAEPVGLEEAVAELDGDAVRVQFVASLEGDSRPLIERLNASDAPDEVRLAIGPEGDFTAGEYDVMRRSGFLPVRLGANVLRAETAAAYMLSVVDQTLRTHRV